MTDQPFPATNLRPWLDQMQADTHALAAATALTPRPGVTLHFAHGETVFMPGDWTVHTEYMTRPAVPGDREYDELFLNEVYTGQRHISIELATYSEDYPK